MKTILVANRGEIACRVIQAAKDEGYQTVAVYSQADADSPFVDMADRAVALDGNAASETYLDIGLIIEAARSSGADAIHPGYGFLSENAEFASACAEAKITFIGPSPSAIDIMGNKGTAKRLMIEAGVPCIPGFEAPNASDDELLVAAVDVGFPLMVKAAAGGGGRGMRLVETIEGLASAISSARLESLNAFSSEEVILERAFVGARHIEIQIAADQHGNVVHLAERDCSVQRRHQKVIEEAPSTCLTEALRSSMGEAAILAAKAVSYVGVGTVEFLLDEDGQFYFLEMNTRLQVEHPVTECVTGIDLVSLQFLIAEGGMLPLSQEELTLKGHAIEVRIYAEDPSQSFRPQTGAVLMYEAPRGNGIRVDSGIREGSEISPYYDAMIAKLIAWGDTRDVARRRLVSALRGTTLLGLTTNKAFLLQLLEHPDFVSGSATTAMIDDAVLDRAAQFAVPTIDELSLAAVTLHAGHGQLANWSNAEPMLRREVFEHAGERSVVQLLSTPSGFGVTVGDESRRIAVKAVANGRLEYILEGVSSTLAYALVDDQLSIDFGSKTLLLTRATYEPPVGADAAGSGEIMASTEGKVTALLVEEGDLVVKDQPLVIVEAMKMEHRHLADGNGRVVRAHVAVDQQVKNRQLLMTVELDREEVTS